MRPVLTFHHKRSSRQHDHEPPDCITAAHDLDVLVITHAHHPASPRALRQRCRRRRRRRLHRAAVSQLHPALAPDTALHHAHPGPPRLLDREAYPPRARHRPWNGGEDDRETRRAQPDPETREDVLRRRGGHEVMSSLLAVESGMGGQGLVGARIVSSEEEDKAANHQDVAFIQCTQISN
ncbi:hypothetical protein CCHR01_17657 [Colletotrichum chrysophilum]|uniref:Uncharacterized protein n=1 Tax=Colletotrichum chrysophilum TaxID=1836956 RepID=A0AAD9E9N9_9PEZI|nr:hypothetical protein CCHR01_17657 [Colletotrichum chrysophilum]